MRLEKGGVTERAVPADREEDGAAPGELGRGLAQAGELRRSDAAEIIAIEAEDDVGGAWPHLSVVTTRILETFGRGVNHLGGHEMTRRLATFPSIPYAAVSRTRDDMAIRQTTS